MIIKSVRVPTGEPLTRIVAHLFHGPENVSMRVLRGCEADLADFRRPALVAGSTYAIRHFVVAPQVALTEDEYLAVVDDLAREFGFDPAVCVVILHEKPRAVPASPTHLHVLVPEVDPVKGGVLDSAHDFLRHEKLSRLIEWRYGHPLLEGEHLKAVLRHLEREGYMEVCRGLRQAYPQASGGREAFASHNAARVKRVAGLDLAFLKHSARAAWRANPTPAGLAAWLVSEGLTLAPGDQPRTLVLSKDDVHIASLNRFLGLRKGPTYEDLRHVPDLVAARLADRERRDPGPLRDPSGAPAGRERVPAIGPQRGVGTGGGPGDGDPRRPDCNTESPGRCAGQPSGLASATRPVEPSRVRRRTLAARLRLAATDTTLHRLATVREVATRVAVTAGEACQQWIEDGLAAIEAERTRLTDPDDHLDDEIERLARRADLMTKVHDDCEGDLAKAKDRLAEVEQVIRARAWWGWFARKPDPDAHRKAKENLKAAQFRFDNAVKMEKDATRANARERQRVMRLRKDNAASLPDALATLDRRAEALRTFGYLIATQPQIAYGGPPAFEAWVREDRPFVPVPAADNAEHHFSMPHSSRPSG